MISYPRRRRRPHPPVSIQLPSRFRAGWLGPVFLLALAGLLSLDHWIFEPAAGGDVERYHGRTFRVVEVIDGDTIDIAALDGDRAITRVRLWGVDTPEIGHGPQSTMYFGPEAKQFAEQLLLGRDVYIVLWPQDTRDKFGRLLAYVYLERDGPMFNEMLVEQGYAYADFRFDHPWRQEFESAEKAGRRRSAGLWTNVSLADMPKWRQQKEKR